MGEVVNNIIVEVIFMVFRGVWITIWLESGDASSVLGPFVRPKVIVVAVYGKPVFGHEVSQVRGR